jgi:hypothetical protein
VAKLVIEDQGATSDRATRRWMFVARLSMLVAVPFFFVGLLIGGTTAGWFVIVAGALILLAGVITLLDIGGAGSRFAAIYQDGVQRHIPFAAPPEPSQRIVFARFLGAGTVVGGLAFCAAGLALLAGWLAPP